MVQGTVKVSHGHAHKYTPVAHYVTILESIHTHTHIHVHIHTHLYYRSILPTEHSQLDTATSLQLNKHCLFGMFSVLLKIRF